MNSHQTASPRFLEAKRTMKEAPIEFITVARDEYRTAARGFRDRQYEIMLEIYAFAMLLSRDAELMDEFYALDFFHQRQFPPKHRDILRMSMIFVLGSFDGPEYKRALALASALKPLFEKQASTEKVAEALITHGIRGLIDGKGAAAIASAGALHDIDNSDFKVSEKTDEVCGSNNRGDRGVGSANGVVGENGNDTNRERPIGRSTRERKMRNLLAAFNDMLEHWDGSPVLFLHTDEMSFAKAMGTKVGRKGIIQYNRSRTQGKYVRLEVNGLKLK